MTQYSRYSGSVRAEVSQVQPDGTMACNQYIMLGRVTRWVQTIQLATHPWPGGCQCANLHNGRHAAHMEQRRVELEGLRQALEVLMAFA